MQIPCNNPCSAAGGMQAPMQVLKLAYAKTMQAPCKPMQAYQTARFGTGLFAPTPHWQRMTSSASSFAPISIVIVAAEGEVTSPSAATIRMKIEANLETLDDIRCQLFVGVNHHKRPVPKRSVCYSHLACARSQVPIQEREAQLAFAS